MAPKIKLADKKIRDRLIGSIISGATDEEATDAVGMDWRSVRRYATRDIEFARVLTNAQAVRDRMLVSARGVMDKDGGCIDADLVKAPDAIIDASPLKRKGRKATFPLTTEGVMGFFQRCAMDDESATVLQAQAREYLWDFFCRPAVKAQERRDAMIDMATPVTAKASTERGLTAGTVEQVMDAIAGKAIPSPE